MDPYISAEMDKVTPEVNKEFGRGYPTTQVPRAAEYLHNMLLALKFHERLHPEFRYIGYESVDPRAAMAYHRDSAHPYDFARSDIYPVSYKFSFKGQEFKHELMMPFINDGGIIHMAGSRYLISPVLCDRVFSMGSNQIFVRLNRAKLNFSRTSSNLLRNGQTRVDQIDHSVVYNKQGKAKSKSKSAAAAMNFTSLGHYLFARLGLRETFSKYCGYVPEFGDISKFTEELYPRTEWWVYTNLPGAPAVRGKAPEVQNTMAVAVPMDKLTPGINSLIFAFLHICRRFPDRMLPVDGYYDSQRLLKVLMGYLIWSNEANGGEGKLHDDVDDHLKSLDEYVDTIMAAQFEMLELPIATIFDLFYYIIENFSEMVSSSHVKITSMYDKHLDTLFYLMEGIVRRVNTYYFEQRKKGVGDKNADSILEDMRKRMTRSSIFSIVKGRGEVEALSFTGDNMLTRVVTSLVPQEEAGEAHKKSNGTSGTSNPSRFLHSSIAEVGSYLGLRKNEPTGRSRFNVFAQTTDGVIKRNPEIQGLLDRVQVMITRD